jgi:hypothetical protein
VALRLTLLKRWRRKERHAPQTEACAANLPDDATEDAANPEDEGPDAVQVTTFVRHRQVALPTLQQPDAK